MWRQTLFSLLITVPLQASIVFEDRFAANDSSEANDDHHDRVDELIQRALTDFSLRLESQLARPQGSAPPDSPNVVFSPLSIASVLAMVLLGAQGETYTEIADQLGVTAGIKLTGRNSSVHEHLGHLINMVEQQQVKHSGTSVSIAHGLFLQQDLHVKQTFINQTLEIYDTEIQRVNFQQNPTVAQEVINKWVENQTEGHIKDLLQQPLGTTTKIVITSALYFNGQWEAPFDPKHTKMMSFYIGKQAGSIKDEEVKVYYMIQGAKVPYHVDTKRKCTIVGMPYKGKKFTMYIIVPDEDVKTFLDNIAVHDLEQLVKETKETAVVLSLPRMRLESAVNLNSPLRNMGIKSLFDSKTANLTNIAEDVFVNEAVHKVEIDVTESGTVAAAATALALNRVTPSVLVDKPFVFFIRHDKTGMILFWGTVIKPTPHYPAT